MKRASQVIAVALVIGGLVIGGIGTSSWAGETFYRWTDDRGHTVHSDRPPPEGVKYEVVSTESTLVREVDSDEGAVPARVKPSAGNDFEAVDTNATIVEKNPEFCQRAKDNLKVLETDVKIQMRDKNGDLRTITQEERDLQRKKAMDTMAIHCE